MKWAIYLLISMTISAWFTLQFERLREQRAEFAAKSFIELMKVYPHPQMFIDPPQKKERDSL